MTVAGSSTPKPLAGRARERARLREQWRLARAGQGSLVLVGGEAGIGKTALAESLLADVAVDATVLIGRCYDLTETPPYGPWREAFATLSCLADAPPLPQAVAAAGEGIAVAGQEALFAQVRAALAAHAAVRPLAILLDDLHWADAASLELLRALGRQLATLPILLIATYRDELTRHQPLFQQLPVLGRETGAPHLVLRRLTQAALQDLIGHYTLAADDATRLIAWLLERAEGNAFFTTQLLRMLEEDAVLRPSPAGWVVGDLAAAGLPAPLRQLLDARLARLGARHRNLLTLAAVIGQEIPLAVWMAVAEMGEADLLDTCPGSYFIRLRPFVRDLRFRPPVTRRELRPGGASASLTEWREAYGA